MHIVYSWCHMNIQKQNITMGKMKELYMKMLEEQMNQVLIEHVPIEPSPTDILCPNCMKQRLTYYNTDDIKCDKGCGHEFTLVNANTVRFKWW